MFFLIDAVALILFGFGVFKTVYNVAETDRFKKRFYFRPSQGFLFYILSALAFVLSSSLVSVDAGSVGVVKTFGKPVAQIQPGLHLILPYQDVNTVAVQTRVWKPNEEAASHDLQVVHTEVTMAYHVDPDYATFVAVNLNNEAEERVINPAILEAIKAVTAQYDAQQLISNRPAVRDGIELFVKQRLAPYHIIVENVSITNFSFSDDYNKAIEAKVTAQQNAEKASNDLKRIQIEADQKVAQATGEANALRVQKEQITPELLQLRTIEMMAAKWDGKLPENYVSTGNDGALPMLDVLKAGKEK